MDHFVIAGHSIWQQVTTLICLQNDGIFDCPFFSCPWRKKKQLVLQSWVTPPWPQLIEDGCGRQNDVLRLGGGGSLAFYTTEFFLLRLNWCSLSSFCNPLISLKHCGLISGIVLKTTYSVGLSWLQTVRKPAGIMESEDWRRTGQDGKHSPHILCTQDYFVGLRTQNLLFPAWQDFSHVSTSNTPEKK